MDKKSLKDHIAILEEKHEALAKKIRGEEAGEVYTDEEMEEMKRRKLLLKDEIAQAKAELKRA